MLFGRDFKINSEMNILKDGDILEFGENPIEIIGTPGHSAGGICIKIGDFLFTGDTLFKESIGRTDLYTGDMDTIIKSIKEKLLTLGDNIIIYPGHGPSSTIGYEKRNNGFLI
jgi:glyoxylase-like metal-dependent hydrolase (beta-lactamase superfamily II)